MNYEFKILAFSNEADFAMKLASECNKYGFLLSFIESSNDLDLELSEDVIAVVIIDLNEELLDPFELGNFIKKNYHLPVFGVLNKFSKAMQDNAKSNGFDLIFTKKMLIRSIRDVIIHVSNE